MIYGTPTIVTNGLVLNLDAANTKSYVSGSTNWGDLSGNNNSGSLINGPTFNNNNGGNITFNGTTNYILSSASINTGQNFTVDVWFRAASSGRGGLVSNSYLYTTNVGWYFFIGGGGAANSLALSIGTDQSYVQTAANTILTNQWYNACGVVTNGGSNIQIYLNGILQPAPTSILGTRSIAYTIPNYKIGALLLSGYNDYYSGNISSTKIYNRALSQAEILQNYNALKSRFGLS